MRFSRAMVSMRAGEVRALDAGQQLGELLAVGRGQSRDRVERGEDDPLLLLGELDVDDRDGRLALRAGELDAQVTVDQVAAGAVDDHALHEADLVEYVAECLTLRGAVLAPVGGVGEQILRRFLAVADDAVGPGGYGC